MNVYKVEFLFGGSFDLDIAIRDVDISIIK